MDIKKLKYDLALQCALIETLKEQTKQSGSENSDIRISMLENFKAYYLFYNALDESNYYDLINQK